MSDRIRISRVSTIKKMGMDLLENSKSVHRITALLELDFSDYRESIKNYRHRNHQGLSVLSFIIKGLADTLALHPNIQTFQLRNNRALEFLDVDIGFVVEKEIDGIHIPETYIIRDANAKSIGEVHCEIEKCISERIQSDSPFANRKAHGFSLFIPISREAFDSSSSVVSGGIHSI